MLPEEEIEAFISAVSNNLIQTVKNYLGHGVDVNSADDDTNTTALHAAASNNDLEMVSLLLQFGARPDVFDNFGQTPLSIARKLKNPSIIGLMEQALKKPPKLSKK